MPTLPSSGIPYESPPWGGMRPSVAVLLAALAFAVCFMTGVLLFGPSDHPRTVVEAVGATPGAKLPSLGQVPPVPELSNAAPAPVPPAAPPRRAAHPKPKRAPAPVAVVVATPERTPHVAATPVFSPEPTPVPTPVFVPAPTRAAPKPTPRATPQPTPVQTFDDGGQPSGSFDDGGGGTP
jgi:hypothetical protein